MKTLNNVLKGCESFTLKEVHDRKSTPYETFIIRMENKGLEESIGWYAYRINNNVCDFLYAWLGTRFREEYLENLENSGYTIASGLIVIPKDYKV